MRMRRWLALVTVLLLVFPYVACDAPFECTDAIGCVDVAPDEPIKIGVILSFTGGGASYGAAQANGIEIALAERDNQLLGHPIELISEDSGCLSEGGTTVALKIVADPQVVAILGTTCSGAGATASRVMSEAGLVMVSPSNIAPSLTAVGGERGSDWQPGYFRTIYNGIIIGEVAARFAREELGIARAATIDDGDTYTEQLASAFGQVFTELGGEISLAATVNKGDTNMRPVLAAIAASGAEFLFLPIFPAEGAAIVLQAKEVRGMESIVILGAESLMLDDFIETTGADGAGMYFIGAAPPEGALNDELVSKYEARFGEPPDHVTYGYAYDAANLVLDAIEAVAVQEDDGTLHIGRQALRDALYNTSGFEGVTGSLTSDEFGDCSSDRFDVMRLDDPAAGLEGLSSNVIYTHAQGQ